LLIRIGQENDVLGLVFLDPQALLVWIGSEVDVLSPFFFYTAFFIIFLAGMSDFFILFLSLVLCAA
jgi:hypothetical protein